MKHHHRIPGTALLFIALALGLATTIACDEDPEEITIEVEGAQASSTQNLYFVEIPEEGKKTVTITGSGKTPCPTDSEKCSCQHNTDKLTPEEDGAPKFTFSPMGAGKQEANNGPKVTWEVDSSTDPGEYKFKVTNIEQKYKPCPSGWTGGVSSKSNTQASDEVKIIAVKLRFTQVRGGLPFTGWGTWGQPANLGSTWGSGSFTKTIRSATTGIKRINHAPSSGGSCNSVGASNPSGYSTAGLLILEITVPGSYKLELSGDVSLSATKTCSGAGGSAQAVDPNGNIVANILGANSTTNTFSFESGTGKMFVNPNIAIVGSDGGEYDFSGSISIDSIDLKP